ncbi:MAG: phosphoribosylformylglycinamidine synthase subunit PurL [Actinobacteria bacterium]|nr:phosphoribosylformylglycinamidine synthase subunit PurL [Actinomycetota bacterium]
MTAPAFPDDEQLDEPRARELATELGLASDEFDAIVTTLGRLPSVAELGMYSVMWSEHCSYKSSKVHLGGLPTEGPQVLVGPGENAGVVDVGDGLAVTFKLESHNHPSYVEPYQGAATGVGGIIRDILTMGARPIAVMDPLRFGLPADPQQRHLIDGVVRGVGGYGNCVGVANIGGEVAFDDCYAGNPLVNVLCIGVLPQDRLQLAKAERPGDVAVLLGSATGRDGIGGASVLASAEFSAEGEDKRPSVQVGDPFAEKLLIECCLELYDRDLLSGIQDMGAAGIACSTAEMASKADLGMRVDLDAVHLREPDMESWEILCSESQERMLALVSPDHLDEVLSIADKWGVPASVIGEVVGGDRLLLERRGEVVGDAPARSLADEGPTYHRPLERPAHLDGYTATDAEALSLPDELEAFVLRFLASPNIASRRWVFEQYDALVGSGTVLPPGAADAGVVRLPGSRRGVACATDGNGRWCELDPREGTRRVVAEAYRNVACTGARPLATTNCLNFGNPERPEIMWQFAEAVAGLGEACAELGIPVTGGNVSFYNETAGQAIHPTPVVGVIGVIDDVAQAVPLAFQREADVLIELGPAAAAGLAGSEFQRVSGAPLGGRIAPVDLAAEERLAGVLLDLARHGTSRSAHDVSTGGMLTTLAESAVAGGVGVAYESPAVATTQALFGESPGRVLLTVSADAVGDVLDRCAAAGVGARVAGTVGGDRFRVDGLLDLPLNAVREALEGGLAAAVDPPA